jgi:phytoene synthase
MSDPLVELSRQTIAKGSKSFAAASRLLGSEARDGATLLYAWCRYCDDHIDLQDLGRGAPGGADGTAVQRLDYLREQTRLALAGETVDAVPFQALQRVVELHAIPHHHPQELIEGFAMDVTGRNYVEIDDTLEYSYHVAGVVGVMMAHVLGVQDLPTFRRAADLGIALQLTNIARDVMDDASAGRVYLPSRWLEGEGVAPQEIAETRHRAAVARVVRRVLETADRYYDSGAVGIRSLDLRSAWAIHAARGVYREIGRVVTARGAEAWDGRTVVGRGRKLYRMARAAGDAAIAVSIGRLAAKTPRDGLWTKS